MEESDKHRYALRADSGLGLGTVYPLVKERNVLGRAVDASIPVDDTRVSRAHAAVDFHKGRILLVDLSSTNGTFVNGVKIEHSIALKMGDHVRVGSSVFIVESLDHVKRDASRNWKEPTRAMMRKDLEVASLPMAPALDSQLNNKARARYLSWPYLYERRMALLWFLCSLLVLAAIAASYF